MDETIQRVPRALKRVDHERPHRFRIAVETKAYLAPESFVVEIRDRVAVLRPVRTKRGGKQEVTVSWGAMYDHGLLQRIAETRPGKRVRRKR